MGAPSHSQGMGSHRFLGRVLGKWIGFAPKLIFLCRYVCMPGDRSNCAKTTKKECQVFFEDQNCTLIVSWPGTRTADLIERIQGA
jgi:hypothetical protein